jgi:tRNA/tmRNA/rRNA uracil-C5-methylase (TrmA/RlmC/RlmD family)
MNFFLNHKKKLIILGATISVATIGYGLYIQWREKKNDKNIISFNENEILKEVFPILNETLKTNFKLYEQKYYNKLKIERILRNIIITINSHCFLFIISKVQLNIINTHLFLKVYFLKLKILRLFLLFLSKGK